MDVNGIDLEASSSPSVGAHINELAGDSTRAQAGRYTQDFPQARGLLSQPDTFGSSMAYGDKATSDAIRQRSGLQPYLRQENQLKLDMLKNAGSDRLRALSAATTAASEEVQLNKQKSLLRWQIDQANKKARGAVLGNVLGIVGGVVGGVAGAYAGGPAGAVAGAGAGASLGQGAGNAMGSS